MVKLTSTETTKMVENAKYKAGLATWELSTYWRTANRYHHSGALLAQLTTAAHSTPSCTGLTEMTYVHQRRA